MNFDTPLVEYLIIGAHAFVWMFLIVCVVLRIPLSSITGIDPAAVLLFVPFVYLLGMLVDSLVQSLLDGFRKRIRDGIFDYPRYKDEVIALESAELYTAYEARVRRVRVMGAAIFNWPILGTALLLHLGLSNVGQTAFIAASAAALGILSILVWRGLYERAYRFRKNAIDAIRDKIAADMKVPHK